MQIDVSLPDHVGDDEVADLLRREWDRGRELMRAGAIVRIWRRPGALRNIGIWRAADADELHELLTSLPLSRWFTVQVDPLATHPLENADG